MRALMTSAAIALSLAVATPAPAMADETPRPDPLAQIRAEHAMISTGDYDRLIGWYRDVIGFRVRHEWTVPEFPGVRLAYIALNGFVIEVVETPAAFQATRTPPDLGAALSDRGFGHLAFLAADVDAVAEALARRGVAPVLPPTSFPDSGRRVLFVQDPDGNHVEFLTPLSAYERAD